MRIAAFSDVHGDVEALERVLGSVAADEVDLIANLGDSFSGALFPHAVAELLAKHSVITVRGNHERIMAGAREDMALPDLNAVEKLSPEHLRWICSLPAMMRPLSGVLLVHGVPGDDTIGFLESATAQGMRAASEQEIAARLQGETASLILCGHTHVPRIHRRSSGQLILCPGSVYRPLVENNPVLATHFIEGMTVHAVATKVEEQWNAELVLIEKDGSERRFPFAD